MKDIQDSQNKRRLEAAKKLLLPEHVELARKWLHWRDFGWHSEEEKQEASTVHGNLHYALSSVALPTFDDLWLAAQRVAEEQMTEEERAKYKAVSAAREDYEWAVMEHGDALNRILQAEGEVKFKDPRLVETDARVDKAEAALIALGIVPQNWRPERQQAQN